MVTRILTTINDIGNLFNAADNYGNDDDRVIVLSGVLGSFSVQTYAGSDIIDATNSVGDISMYGGSGNDNLTGSAHQDNSYDGAGNDFVNLGAGTDIAHADIGNDLIYGGSGSDTVSFLQVNVESSLNYDFNTAAVVFDLNLTTQNLGIFGTDTYFGFESVNSGNGNDKLFGNAGPNTLFGNGGNDILDGRAGNDTLAGAEGADLLIGGIGKDDYEMGLEAVAKRDTVRFLSLADSAVTQAGADVIFGFDKGGLATDDKIDLSLIDANALVAGNQAFHLVGALTAAGGEIKLTAGNGFTSISLDTDADAAPEMMILVVGVTGLTAADFIL